VEEKFIIITSYKETVAEAALILGRGLGKIKIIHKTSNGGCQY